MLLQLATWPEVEQSLVHNTTVIVPIGSTEQHGPLGLIGTDAILAEFIAEAVGEKLGVFVAPTINVGMAQHHLGFAGSITLRPTTLVNVVVDIVTSLARNGFERFFWINGHGGNVATLNAAFAELYASRSLAPGTRNSVVCHLCNWWALPNWERETTERFGAGEGIHGTPGEVSLVHFARPGSERDPTITSEPSPVAAWTDADDFRAKFPDGRVGSRSELATKEHGAALFDVAVAETIAEYEMWMSGIQG